jgi:hypothetical protein
MTATEDPRRLMLVDLVTRLAVALATQARAYEAAAGQAEDALGQRLGELVRAKNTQMADLAPLARTLGIATASESSAAPLEAPLSWGVILGEAFQGERVIERLGRELAVLARDPLVKAGAARVAVGAARDGETVRKLYLRYS